MANEKQTEPRQNFESFFDEFAFGQYMDKSTGKGEQFVDILETNPGYVHWILKEGIISVDPKMKDRVDEALGKWAEGRPNATL